MLFLRPDHPRPLRAGVPVPEVDLSQAGQSAAVLFREARLWEAQSTEAPFPEALL